MAKYNYAGNVEENMAKAVGRSLPISTKQCIEICNFIRNKSITRAKRELNQVLLMKMAVPYRRCREAPHKKGIGPGKYPIKACEQIISLIEEAAANAQYKGLGGNLQIVHTNAQKADTPWHFGRKRRRKMKRTHVEMVVKEMDSKDKKKESKDVKSQPISKDTKKPTSIKKENTVVKTDSNKDVKKETKGRKA